MIKNLSRLTKIYLGVLVVLLVIAILIGSFSGRTEEKCYVCGQKGIGGKDITWQRLGVQWYYYQARKFEPMGVIVPMCDKCEHDVAKAEQMKKAADK
jgi:hypothetical protein